MISRQGFLHALVNSLYSRDQGEFKRGTFRVKGDTVISTFLMWIMDIALLFLAMRLKKSKVLNLNPANASARWTMPPFSRPTYTWRQKT